MHALPSSDEEVARANINDKMFPIACPIEKYTQPNYCVAVDELERSNTCPVFQQSPLSQDLRSNVRTEALWRPWFMVVRSDRQDARPQGRSLPH